MVSEILDLEETISLYERMITQWENDLTKLKETFEDKRQSYWEATYEKLIYDRLNLRDKGLAAEKNIKTLEEEYCNCELNIDDLISQLEMVNRLKTEQYRIVY